MFRKLRTQKTGYAVLAVVVASLPAFAQAPVQATGPTDDESSARMITPSPVSGQGYSLEFASETPRTNYIRGGLNFSTAYDSGVTTDSNGPVGDVSYTIFPTIALDQTRSRLSWDLSYSPGFTFYQKTTSLNQTNHTADVGLHFRLTPHITFTVHDDLQKATNPLSDFGQNPSTGAGGLNPPILAVAPITDQIRNQGDVGVTYQFAANGMVGASGFSSILQFPDLTPSSGLFNSNARGGEGFFSQRVSGRHYLGATYRYQQLRTTPDGSLTISNSVFAFYTVLLKPTMSLSFLGGPEHSTTTAGTTLSVSQWSPAYGGSFGWQAARTSVAASLRQSISAGNGLSVATQSGTADLSVRQQLSPRFTVGGGTNYSDNKALKGVVASGGNGHTLSARASLDIVLQEHLGLEFGYARLHQSYSNIPAIAIAPNRNRVWISLSYQFQRPIGR